MVRKRERVSSVLSLSLSLSLPPGASVRLSLSPLSLETGPLHLSLSLSLSSCTHHTHTHTHTRMIAESVTHPLHRMTAGCCRPEMRKVWSRAREFMCLCMYVCVCVSCGNIARAGQGGERARERTSKKNRSIDSLFSLPGEASDADCVCP